MVFEAAAAGASERIDMLEARVERHRNASCERFRTLKKELKGR